ncbi:MAG: (Fe-S)-binding protein [Planctomycetota bacterium]|nr:MAG: (Fe-S)-binding protein [Planctomycetota bacterium]
MNPASARPEGKTWLDGHPDPLADFPGLLDCVHCGLCLPVCPSYRLSGKETDSPRGRIALLRGAAENRLKPDDIVPALDRCLLCRACETVCPSRVPYHRLVEQQREGLPPAWILRSQRRWLSSAAGIRLAGIMLRSLRSLGILGLVERFAPRRLRAMAGTVPLAPHRFRPQEALFRPAHPPRRGRVGLHLGCVQAEFFGQVLEDTIAVLQQQGFDVEIPPQVPCCGSLAAHNGDAAEGRRMADRTLQAFDPQLDAVLIPAAGCLGHLQEFDRRRPCHDPAVFLFERGLRGRLRPLTQRLAYDPPCHLSFVAGKSDVVTALLHSLPGVELRHHDEADTCCGAGGVAFLRQPEQSQALLQQKIDRLLAVDPEVIVSGNPGCQMRLEAGLRQRNVSVPVVHPIQLLRKALSI